MIDIYVNVYIDININAKMFVNIDKYINLNSLFIYEGI